MYPANQQSEVSSCAVVSVDPNLGAPITARIFIQAAVGSFVIEMACAVPADFKLNDDYENIEQQYDDCRQNCVDL